MKHLHFDKRLKQIINKAKKIILFLDYDGTLTSIVPKPELAILPKKTKKLLEEISENSEFIVSIVSGRSLKTIKKLVGIKKIVYVGNHGLEIELPERSNKRDRKKLTRVFRKMGIKNIRHLMKKVAVEIEHKTKNIKGIYFENKELTLSLHWRNIEKPEISKVKRLVQDIYKHSSHLKFIKGKKVLNICPSIEWDKGKAVKLLLTKFVPKTSSSLAIYVGDDITDEYAFKVLNNKSMTIRVGKNRNSYAEYYLRNTEGVCKFLYFINHKNKISSRK